MTTEKKTKVAKKKATKKAATKKAATKKATAKESKSEEPKEGVENTEEAENTDKSLPSNVRMREGVVMGWSTYYVPKKVIPITRNGDEGKKEQVGTRTFSPALLGVVTVQDGEKQYSINYGRERLDDNTTREQAINSEEKLDLIERLFDAWPPKGTVVFKETHHGDGYIKRKLIEHKPPAK